MEMFQLIMLEEITDSTGRIVKRKPGTAWP